MAKYSVFESTNMRAVHYAERIFDCVFDEDVENGTFGYFEEKADGYTHIYKFVKGVKEGCPVVVANNPAWNEDECRRSNQRRDQYIIPAGTPFRAFEVGINDEFGITIEGFAASSQDAVAVGAYVTIGEDGKLVVAESAEGAYGVIERKRMIGATLLTGIREYGYANEMFEIRVIG